MTLNITQIVDSQFKKRNLINLIETIEPSSYFHIEMNVSTANKKRPMLAHIHAMINQCAYASGLDPQIMKSTLKGLYLCDIMRTTDKKFRETVEAFEKETGMSLKGEVTGTAANVKDSFGKSISLSPSGQMKMTSLRFLRQKIEEHLGHLEAANEGQQ